MRTWLHSDLDQEREISRRFLVDAVANYWDREWRREHRGSRRTPELMLWEAVRGYFQLTGDIEVEWTPEKKPSLEPAAHANYVEAETYAKTLDDVGLT